MKNLIAAFNHVGLDYSEYLVIDEQLYRPAEVNMLQGDASRAHKKLKWFPQIQFEALIQDMVESDLRWYSNQ